MKIGKFCLWLTATCVVCLIIQITESRSVGGIRSDVIQTKFGPDPEDDYTKPEWMVSYVEKEFDSAKIYSLILFQRTQLSRFGEMAGRVGNNLGKHASIVTNAVDKVCEVVKTVIPLLAAVCRVGKFKFCSATEEAPIELENALNPSIDLNMPD